jgi:HAD superfamily hydrolase (TIGR01509 family)
MAPAAVIFDLGKVLLDFDYDIAVGRLARDSDVSPDAIRGLLGAQGLLERYESGRLSSEAFHAALRAGTGYRSGYAAFRAVFADIFSPIDPMVALHGRLRERGVPTYILSNTNEIAIAHIREAYAFFGDFDGYIYSYEQGALKPGEPLYRAAERVAGRSGADLFYVDDRAENVEAALRLGWRAVLHEDPPRTLAAARAAGLPIE